MKIVGIAGSLRKGSYNRALLEAVKKLAPDGMSVEILEIGEIHLFNQDMEANYPAVAQALKDKIRAADGAIIVTPEYNRSIPGILKNAIDWTSRPYGASAWPGKPVFVTGASGGPIGTAVAQSHLKQILLHMGAYVLGQPELHIGGAPGKFDAQGELINEDTKGHIIKALQVFADFIGNKK